MGCLTFQCNRIGDGLTFNAEKVSKGLSIFASVVCEVNIKFLNIKQEHIFLNEYNNYTDYVDIESNVKWFIN